MNYMLDYLDKDNSRINCFCLIITLLAVKNILFTIPAVLVISVYINIIVVATVIALFIYDVAISLHSIQIGVVIAFGVYAIFCCTQLLLFPRNQTFLLETIPDTIVYGLIPFSFVIQIQNSKMLLEKLQYVSVAIIVASFFGMISIVTSNVDYYYSMSYGNYTVIGVAIIEYYFFSTRRIRYGILLALGVSELVIGGSRASLLVIVSLLVIYYVLIYRIKTIKQLAGWLFAVIGMVFCIVNYNYLVILISKLLGEYGINSRNIFLLTKGEFFSSSSRVTIYDLCIKIINQNPVLGIGTEGLQGLGYTDLSPHNLYLELLLYYGMFFGSILIIVLILLWAQGLSYRRDFSMRCLTIIWFSLYVPRSFVGAGLLTNISFWILLALCIKATKNRFVIKQKENAA